MTRWLTSDQHYNHENVIEYCNRPFTSASHMNEVLIANHNERVRPEDEVFHLGDFSLRVPVMEAILPRLNGTHYLVPGNHDGCHPKHKKKQRTKRYEAAGFIVLPVFNTLTLKNGMEVDLCHIPHTNQDPRYPEWKPTKTENWLLCGHVHQNFRVLDRQLNVGVDVHNFYPISEDEVIAIIEAESNGT